MSSMAPEATASTQAAPAEDATRNAENAIVSGRTTTGAPVPPATTAPKPAAPKRNRNTGSGSRQSRTPAPAPTVTPASSDEGLRANQKKQVVGDALIDAAAAMVKGWKPQDHQGVTVEEAFDLAGSYCSFTPGKYWSIYLAVPETGRGEKHKLTGKEQQEQRKFLASVKPAKPARRSRARNAA